MWGPVILLLGVVWELPCTAESSPNNKWPRPTIISQDYSGVLLSIEQRLRGLDGLRHLVSRSELSLGSLLGRMELIESRLQTVQSSLTHTLEATSTAVKSSEMKYELLLEQLSRKVEAGFDRLSHRINSLESRTEGNINQLQNHIEQNIGKIDNKQSIIGNDVVRLIVNVDEIKTRQANEEERQNQTSRILISHLEEIHLEQGAKREHLKNISNQLADLHNRTDSYPQNDAPLLPGESIRIIKNEIGDEVHKMGAKVNNMYNDLWRTIKDLELSIKGGFEESNSSSRHLYNRLTEMLMDEQKNTESFMDVVMRSVLTSVGEHLNDLQRQVEGRFKDLKISQEKHGEACHKTHDVIENQVGLILTKIYDTFINRTDRFSKQMVELAEMLKSHNKQLSQSTGETSRLLVTLAEESSHDHKQLDNSIADLSDSYQDLQMQAQEMNDLFIKNHGTIREIKNIILSIKENNNNKNVSNSLPKLNIKAVEANFSNGVINIKMNSSDLEEGKGNGSVTEGERSLAEVPLETLSKSIATKELVAVMGEPRSAGGHQMKREFEAEEERRVEEEVESSGGGGGGIDRTQLLLAYIKLLQGHLSAGEFLAEAVPGQPYSSFGEMLTHLRRTGGVPRETLHDIQQFAQDHLDKDSHQTESSDAESWRIFHKLDATRDVDADDENYDDEEETE